MMGNQISKFPTCRRLFISHPNTVIPFRGNFLSIPMTKMPSILLLSLLLAGAVTAADYLPRGSAGDGPVKYIEITRPLPTDGLTPTCSAAVFSHSFANTSGLPPASAAHSPPDDCPGPWYAVALELSAACSGPQRARIAAVWLDGVELLRTSTARPAAGGGFWVVRKDATAYSALLRRPNATLTVMLENAVDEVYTGVYHLNISLFYYIQTNNTAADSKLGVYDGEGFQKLGKLSWDEHGNEDDFDGDLDSDLHDDERKELVKLLGEGAVKGKELGYLQNRGVDDVVGEMGSVRRSRPHQKGGRATFSNKPADLVIPISSNGSDGFWFKIITSSDVLSKSVEIPPNTYLATLEIFVSFHSDDELWYANPPDILPGGHGKGAFRRVFAGIDGKYVASVVPFPVVYAEGINPLFWEPIVGIGTFDVPSYNLELTPFLGMLLDGKPHTVSIGVEDATQFWLVDANLQLWLDHNSSQVHAELVQYDAPALQVTKKYKLKDSVNGKFKTKVQHKTQFSGWVNSSFGNLTTHVINELRFKNKIKIKKDGEEKKVVQTVTATTDMRLSANSRRLFAQLKQRTQYSFELESSTKPGASCTDKVETELSNEIRDDSTLTLPVRQFSSSLQNEQEAEGQMLVQNNSVLFGSSTTEQKYIYSDYTGRYARKVTAKGGELVSDKFVDVLAQA